MAFLSECSSRSTTGFPYLVGQCSGCTREREREKERKRLLTLPPSHKPQSGFCNASITANLPFRTLSLRQVQGQSNHSVLESSEPRSGQDWPSSFFSAPSRHNKNPQVGDVRITYKGTPPHVVTVLARLNRKGELKPYRTTNKRLEGTIATIKSGVHSVAEMFESIMAEANQTVVYGRLVGSVRLFWPRGGVGGEWDGVGGGGGVVRREERGYERVCLP